jgi:hypothetical protein
MRRRNARRQQQRRVSAAEDMRASSSQYYSSAGGVAQRCAQRRAQRAIFSARDHERSAISITCRRFTPPIDIVRRFITPLPSFIFTPPTRMRKKRVYALMPLPMLLLSPRFFFRYYAAPPSIAVDMPRRRRRFGHAMPLSLRCRFTPFDFLRSLFRHFGLITPPRHFDCRR